MLLVGLTGGIASGKSIVSARLAERHHARVVDADRVVKELQRPSMPCARKIAKRWPECIDPKTGEINRAALGGIIFSDSVARRELGRIMNVPIFIAIMKVLVCLWWESLYRRVQGKEPLLVVLDAPLLYETNIYTWFVDFVVVVACTEQQQITRLEKRNGLTQEQALQRMRAQMPLREKCKLAECIIHNDGTLLDLEHAIDKSMEWIRQQPGVRMTCIVFATVTLTIVCVSFLVCFFISLLF